MKKTFLLAVMLFCSAKATDMRLYSSFAEVREPVQAKGKMLAVNLPQEAWKGIVDGSLDLEGLPFNSAVFKLEANWLSSLEGKKVYLVKQQGDEQVTEPVTLVRARDYLIKDSKGMYYNVNYHQLRFDTPPPTNPSSPSQKLEFTLPKPGRGTLSYLTRSLGWSPRYTLKAGRNGAHLTALADITNRSSLPYNIKNTELYAGDVQLQYGGRARPQGPAADMTKSAPVPSAHRAVVAQGELRGLYKYKLTSGFNIAGNSKVTLPFIEPKLTDFQRYVSATIYFTLNDREGTLNRSYRFKADQPLPAGAVTVREEGRIVGQGMIRQTRVGGKIEFNMGEDADVVYTRKVKQLDEQKDLKGNITRRVYQVSYIFENTKDRPVRAELIEYVRGNAIRMQRNKVDKNVQAKVSLDGNKAVSDQLKKIIKVDLPAKKKQERSFKVIMDYR